MLEYARVFDNIYGTPKDMVIAARKSRDVILEIDVQSGLQIKRERRYRVTVLVFVLPHQTSQRRQRIIDRGTETEEVIDKNLTKAINGIKKVIGEYDYIWSTMSLTMQCMISRL